MLLDVLRHFNCVLLSNFDGLCCLFLVVLQKLLLELLIVFEKDIELFGKGFIPLIVCLKNIARWFLCLLLERLPFLHLPLVLLEQAADQLAKERVKLRSDDALLQVVGCDHFLNGVSLDISTITTRGHCRVFVRSTRRYAQM